jgi:hypothetical protein
LIGEDQKYLSAAFGVDLPGRVGIDREKLSALGIDGIVDHRTSDSAESCISGGTVEISQCDEGAERLHLAGRVNQG